METSLLWAAFAIGAAGSLCALLLGRGRLGFPGRAALATAIGLPVVALVVTLPASPPLFSPGQGLGRGFALGAASALIAAAAWRRWSAGTDAAVALGGALMALPSLAAAAVAALFLRASLVDALVGVSMGALAVSAVLYWDAAQRPSQGERGPREPSEGDPRIEQAFLVGAGIWPSALCAAVAIAAHRGTDPVSTTRWCAAALLAAGSAPLATAVAALPTGALFRASRLVPGASVAAAAAGRALGDGTSRAAAGIAGRGLLAMALVTCAAWLLAARLVGDLRILYVVAAGIGTSIALGWLAWAMGAEADADTLMHDGVPADELANAPGWLWPAAVLVLAAGYALAYSVMAGTGTALWLAALFPLSCLALAGPRPPARTLWRPRAAQLLSMLFAAGTVLVVYQLLLTRFGDELGRTRMSDHYALVGIVVGMALPALLVGYVASRLRSGGQAVVPLAIAALVGLTTAGAVMATWGPKCITALLLGLALAVATPLPWPPAPVRRATSGAAVFGLGVALAAAQWTHHAMLAFELSRADRARLLTWSAAILAVVVVVADVAGRIAARRRRVAPGPAMPRPGAS